VDVGVVPSEGVVVRGGDAGDVLEPHGRVGSLRRKVSSPVECERS
jgi:hypothetical protein